MRITGFELEIPRACWTYDHHEVSNVHKRCLWGMSSSLIDHAHAMSLVIAHYTRSQSPDRDLGEESDVDPNEGTSISPILASNIHPSPVPYGAYQIIMVEVQYRLVNVWRLENRPRDIDTDLLEEAPSPAALARRFKSLHFLLKWNGFLRARAKAWCQKRLHTLRSVLWFNIHIYRIGSRIIEDK